MGESTSGRKGAFARRLKHAAIVPLALLIAFEEWGWEPLARLTACVARLPVLAWGERRIVALPPYGALALFTLPWLLLLPMKLFALGLIGSGHILLGAAAVLVLKVAGTAVVARLFTLAKPALMRLPWFASVYERWRAWKDGLLDRVRASSAWGRGRALRRGLRRRFERWRALLSA